MCALKPKGAVTSGRKPLITVAPRRLRDLTRHRLRPPVIRSKPAAYGLAFGRGYRHNPTLLSQSRKTSVAAPNESSRWRLSASSPAEAQQLLFSGRSRKAASPSASADEPPPPSPRQRKYARKTGRICFAPDTSPRLSILTGRRRRQAAFQPPASQTQNEYFITSDN
jgi:hypothetical protein